MLLPCSDVQHCTQIAARLRPWHATTPETMGMTAGLTNWAGNVAFGAKRLLRPSSIKELQHLVAASTHVRALGTGHSFNPIADSPGDLVTLADIRRNIDVDSARSRVKVGAGVH